MNDQTTDRLSEAVEAAVKRWREDARPWPEGLSARLKFEHALAAAEPFFATYYEDKGRSEERERLRSQRDRLLAAVKEHRANWDESWGTHGGPTEEPLASVWNEDIALYKLAKEVESEVGER